MTVRSHFRVEEITLPELVLLKAFGQPGRAGSPQIRASAGRCLSFSWRPLGAWLLCHLHSAGEKLLSLPSPGWRWQDGANLGSCPVCSCASPVGDTCVIVLGGCFGAGVTAPGGELDLRWAGDSAHGAGAGEVGARDTGLAGVVPSCVGEGSVQDYGGRCHQHTRSPSALAPGKRRRDSDPRASGDSTGGR